MTTLIDDYLREVGAYLRADADRKRPILDELRAHISEKVDDLARADPLRAREDIEREVLHDFGSPRDLALGYEPSGHLLRDETGEIILRFGQVVGRGTKKAARAVGRGTGVLLKWTAVALSVVLVLGIGLGVWGFYEVRPVVETLVEQSQPAYRYHESCPGTPCNGDVPAQAFYVSPDAKQVRFSIEAFHGGDTPVNGTARVVVTDPLGEVRLDREFAVGNQTHVSQEARWAPAAGNWTVAYTYVNFSGSLHVASYATSVTWSDV